VLFGALLLGAPDAAAAPPPVNPTDIRVPIADPQPQPPTRRPRPDVADPPSDVAVADPCTESCAPSDPPEEPSAQPEPAHGQPVDEPAAPPSPKATPVDQPRSIPVGIPTPSRVDTGEGPGNPVNWWLVGVPALALLGLAAGGSYVWIRRGERSAR
jgi:hypothetical protein